MRDVTNYNYILLIISVFIICKSESHNEYNNYKEKNYKNPRYIFLTRNIISNEFLKISFLT